MSSPHSPTAGGHTDAHGDGHADHPLVFAHQRERDLLGFEQSDYLPRDAQIASVMAEVRALTGQALAAPGAARVNRQSAIATTAAPAVPAIAVLNEVQARGHITRIVQNLHLATRPGHENIENRIRDRFDVLLAQRTPEAGQGVHAARRVNDTLIVGQALLDAVYEHISFADLPHIANTIASNIPPTAPFDVMRAFYYDDATQSLTENGRALLNRLSDNNPLPSKIIIAFSAALDWEHFNPGVRGFVPPPNQLLVQENLATVLGSNADQMNQADNRNLAAVARALQGYEARATPDRRQTVNPNPTGAPVPPGPNAAAMEERINRFHEMLTEQRTVARALHAFLHGRTIAGRSAYPQRRALQRLIDQLLAGAPATRVGVVTPDPPIAIPPEQIRNLLGVALGQDLQTETQYSTAAARPDTPGPVGTAACDNILRSYIQRVSGIRGEQRDIALASLTSRALSAAEGVLVERDRHARIEESHDAADETTEFNRRNANAWRSLPLSIINLNLPTYWRTPHRQFLRELNNHHGVGLTHDPATDDFVSHEAHMRSVDLRDLKVRYYTLWHLSHMEDPSSPKYLPMTRQLATHLTRMRRAIVERQMNYLLAEMVKRRQRTLPDSTVQEMGLPNNNLDSLDPIVTQERMFAQLDKGAPESGSDYRKIVEGKISHAWAAIEKRKTEWTWKYQFSKKARWYSPVRWAGGVYRHPKTTSAAVGGIIGSVVLFPGLGTAIGAGIGAVTPPVAKAVGSVAKKGWNAMTSYLFSTGTVFGGRKAAGGGGDDHGHGHGH